MTAGVEDDPAGAEPGTARSVITGSGPATVRETAERPRTSITVEQAYRAKLRAAAAAAAVPDPPGTAPAAVVPSRAEAVALPDPEPPASRRRPGTGPARPGPSAVVRKPPAVPVPPPHMRARPRIEPEQGILGLSRRARSRLGSRLFNLFFVCVFALILVQMVVALLAP